MNEQPDSGPDGVPAEVPDHIDPADVVISATPLDEDTSEADRPDAHAELAALAGDE